MISAAKDPLGDLWVYWGTGDKTDPTATGVNEKFFAVKDTERTATYLIGNLEDITSGVFVDSPTNPGWYIRLTGDGEKILAEPVVFGGIVYFTSYTPVAAGTPCNQGGTATLYGVNYITGGAAIYYPASEPGDPASPPVRSITIGTGIPTTPVISFKPSGAMPPDLYVTVSGGGQTGASTTRVPINPPTMANRTNILSWKDRRLQ
jgi:Tfp pilus tip-associated adhesin PilY1